MNKEIASTLSDSSLVDLFSRSISYLRLSITDRCNLRCIYCVADGGGEGAPAKLRHVDMLTYEELLRVVRVAAGLGISKIRLTGGEPLLRRNMVQFVQEMAKIDNLDDIRLTTNGVLLGKYAGELFASGVTKVNVSLDTLKADRYQQITGIDCFDVVWQGIEKALSTGFQPVKINVVAMRGVNDDEVADFVRLTRIMPVQVRFIEFMPVGISTSWNRHTFISSDEIKKQLEQIGQLLPLHPKRTDGPAQVYRMGEDAVGTLGLISPVTHHFCDRCNRLRLTSAGTLRSCLLHDKEFDLAQVIRQGGSDEDIIRAFVQATINKPQGHQMKERLEASGYNCHGVMSRIGG
ncbi:MAG: GTP 3',8-cyclase MoaA [Desulfobulbus propionicus]|nr:MAG: GTP 3',8-cyclase MoaA [Desulfobulbus propionicus]